MMLFSRAMSIRDWSTDFGIVAPVGLFGLLIIINLVLSLIKGLRSSMSGT